MKELLEFYLLFRVLLIKSDPPPGNPTALLFHSQYPLPFLCFPDEIIFPPLMKRTLCVFTLRIYGIV